ncbi:MAG: ComF family protein [Parcubacteria group bacterium]|nr:ComF family protein [Parcubacteria group bacterium]
MLANHCPFCEAKTNFGNTCDSCRGRHFLDGAISCVPYAQPLIRSLIHSWKYNGVAHVTEYLARFVGLSLNRARQSAQRMQAPILATGIGKQALRSLVDTPALLRGEPILLEPIPLHPKREKERGFNQSLLLAQRLAGAGASWRLSRSLSRTKKTAAQATLSGTDRRTNIAAAFELSDPEAVSGQHVVLVDDVITTGSTADALAQLLKEAGSISVWALTIAYGHPAHA